MKSTPNMFLTITESKVLPDQASQLERFLKGFLPRMKKQPGVIAIYHTYSVEQNEDMTIVIWENEDAVRAYRNSELIKEPIAFEASHRLNTTRIAYPIKIALTEKY